MREKIKKLLIIVNQWKVILIILLIGAGLFYWFQVRPSRIYSICHQKAQEKARESLKKRSELEGGSKYKEAVEEEMYLKDDYDFRYKQCLRKYGVGRE